MQEGGADHQDHDGRCLWYLVDVYGSYTELVDGVMKL